MEAAKVSKMSSNDLMATCCLPGNQKIDSDMNLESLNCVPLPKTTFDLDLDVIDLDL